MQARGLSGSVFGLALATRPRPLLRVYRLVGRLVALIDGAHLMANALREGMCHHLPMPDEVIGVRHAGRTRKPGALRWGGGV